MDLNQESQNLAGYLTDRNIVTPTENGYEINTVALDLAYTESGQQGNVQYTVTGQSYITTVSDAEFQQSTKIVSVDTLVAQAQVTQPDPRKPFKCNFSFNINFGIKIKLPDLNAPPPNFDLLYSIYNFTQEVEKINETLIYALKEMNCCDLEEAYNKTLIPFFRWFADHKSIKYCSYDADAEQNCGPMIGDDTFPMIMYDIANVIIQIYIYVRPIICLIRPIPGNPWFLFDIDAAFWIKFLIAFFDLYYDLLVSGKLFDAVFTNPTRKIRQLIEVCIYGDTAIHAAELNLSVVEYNAILGQLKTLKEKEKAQNNLLNKYKSEYNSVRNAILHIEIKKDTDAEIFSNLPDLLAMDAGVATNTLYPIQVPVSEFFCLNNDAFEVDDSCKIMIIDKISSMVNDITFLTKPVTIQYYIKKPDNSGFYFKKEESYNSLSLYFPNFAENLANEIKNYYEQYVEPKKDLYISALQGLTLIKQQEKVLIEQLSARESAQKSSSFAYDNSIMPKSFLTQASINKMANNNSICDCLITVAEILLDKEFKIPMPETIYSFTESGFRDVKDKESFSIKFSDMEIENRKPFYQMCIKKWDVDDETVNDSGIMYCEEFIKELVREIKSVTDRTTVTIDLSDNPNISFKLPGTTDIKLFDSGNPDARPYFDNFLSKKSSNLNLFNPQTLAYNYLYAMDKSFNTETKLLFTIEKNNKTIDFPDGSSSVTIPVLEYNSDYFPKDVYPSTFGLFLLSMEKITEELGSRIDQLKHYYLKKKQEDYTLWLKIQDLINKKLASVNEILSRPLNNFTKLMDAQIIQNDLKQLQSLIGLQYPPFEVKFTNNPFDAVWDIDEDYTFSLELIYDAYQFASNTAKKVNDSNIDVIVEKIFQLYNNRKKAISEEIADSSEFPQIQNIKYPLMQYFYLERLNERLIQFRQDRDIVTDWVWEKPDIPCTCDGIICKLIQTIINMLLSMLTQFIQRLFNYLMELFWKSPIGKLIKFIIAKIKCIMMLINIKNDLDKLKELIDALEEALKNNVKLYTDPGICLNNALNNTTPSFPIQYDPDTHTVSYLDPITPENVNNDIFEQPGVTGQDINDPNYQFPTINVVQNPDGSTTVTTEGGDIPEPFQPQFPSQYNGLPATLVISPQVTVGSPISYPNHKFPLLVFDCDCDPNCIMCNDETKVETANILES